MDFQSIGNSALLGAGFGAIGGALGYVLGRFFPGKMRGWSPLIGVAAGLLAANLVGKGLLPLGPQSTREAPAGETAQDPGIQALDAQLKAVELFTVIAEGFPEEYDAFLHRAVTVHTYQESFEISRSFTSQLRQNNADYLRVAPDASNKDVLSTMLALLKKVRSVSGDTECSSVAVMGGRGLTADPSAYLTELSANATAVMKGIVSGKKSPVPREDATTSDREYLIAAWRKNGASDQMVSAISTPNLSDPAVCEASISLLETAIGLSGPEAERVRSELVVKMAKG